MEGSRSLKYISLKELQSIISYYNLINMYIWRASNPNLRQFISKSLDAMEGSRSLKYISLKELQSIISYYNLINMYIWRASNPNLRQFICHRANPLMMRRLTSWLICNMMLSFVRSLWKYKVIMHLYFCMCHI